MMLPQVRSNDAVVALCRKPVRRADRRMHGCDRLRLLFRAYVRALGADDLDIGYAEKAEQLTQIRFLEIGRRAWCAGAVETTARRRDDHALVAGQFFGSIRAVAERLGGDRDAVDPRLQRARDPKLYIGAPITATSAARNSSSTLPPRRPANSPASTTGVQCGSGCAATSR